MKLLCIPAPGWEVLTDAYTASVLSLKLHDAVKALYES
jgi:hypothetical protein